MMDFPNTKPDVPPEAHTQRRFSWARTNREKTYAYNDTRAKYLREQGRIMFGQNALKSVRKYTGHDGKQITTVELNIEFIEGL